MTGEPERLRRELARLEERLRRFGAPIGEHPLPGLARAQVRGRLAELGLGAPTELETLWAWHDGTDAAAALGLGSFTCAPENQVVGGWHLMTLDEAAAEHASLRRGGPAVFPRSWFPVLHFLDAPVLCADCGGDPARPAPRYIVDEYPLGEPPSPLLGSLTEFAEILVRLFDDGDVVRDERRGPGSSGTRCRRSCAGRFGGQGALGGLRRSRLHFGPS